jgi:hypothetical protein
MIGKSGVPVAADRLATRHEVHCCSPLSRAPPRHRVQLPGKAIETKRHRADGEGFVRRVLAGGKMARGSSSVP